MRGFPNRELSVARLDPRDTQPSTDEASGAARPHVTIILTLLKSFSSCDHMHTD